MTKPGILLAITLALCAPRIARAAQTEGIAVFQLSGFTFDSSMVINLINDAVQTNGVITDYNAGPNAGVVTVTIKNIGSAPGTCYFEPILTQINSGGFVFNCPSPPNQLVLGPVLQTRTQIQPGQTLVANLNNFEVTSGGYSGSVCTDIKSTFQGGSFSDVAKAVLKMSLEACVVPTDSSGDVLGPKACNVGGPSSFFTQPPANATACPLLIDPHNDNVPSALPNFVWTPAFENGSSAGIKYRLVISETEGGQPWASIEVPVGQDYYQWQASDRAFEGGKKYWYHVISEEDVTDKPVGGQNGDGWNTEKWFLIADALDGGGTGISTITGDDIATFYNTNAPASVKAITGDMELLDEGPSGCLSDPDVVYLLSHPSEITSISGQKQ